MFLNLSKIVSCIVIFVLLLMVSKKYKCAMQASIDNQIYTCIFVTRQGLPNLKM